MTRYPDTDQYQAAIQHPATAMTDPLLKTGAVRLHPFGYPLPMSGQFAITYCLSLPDGRRFAVRCFRQHVPGSEAHYKRLSAALPQLGGSYFVGFRYLDNGIMVDDRKCFPIVIMDWIEGDSLGGFVRKNVGNTRAIDALRDQFVAMSRFLHAKGVAHGDLQNGNVLVGPGLKLVDYDGMYVPSMPLGQGSELGQVHFQHPLRTRSDFGPDMDRFSFIVIDLSLPAIAARPALFRSDRDGIEWLLLTKSDYAEPESSQLLAALASIPGLKRDTENFARLCRADMAEIPTLEDFLAGRAIPTARVRLAKPGAVAKAPTQRVLPFPPPQAPPARTPPLQASPPGNPPSPRPAWLPPFGPPAPPVFTNPAPAPPGPAASPWRGLLVVAVAALIFVAARPLFQVLSTVGSGAPGPSLSEAQSPPATQQPAAVDAEGAGTTAPRPLDPEPPAPSAIANGSARATLPLPSATPSAPAAAPVVPPSAAPSAQIVWAAAPGADVSSLQAALNRLGFDVGPIDGKFGNRTGAALAAFAKANRLDAADKAGILQRAHALAESAPPRVASRRPDKVEIEPSYTRMFDRGESFDVELAVLEGLNAGVDEWQTFDFPSGLRVEGRFMDLPGTSTCKIANLRASGRYAYPDYQARFCLDGDNVWRQVS